jgi:SAM-dependent methyltransferase
MHYNPKITREQYNSKAKEEDVAEKARSLRVEMPREFIKRYIKKSDIALDAGGGTGINAIMMAKLCKKVTLLDISPKILKIAKANIRKTKLDKKIDIVEGDITNLKQFKDGQFSFIVCVGDSISYVLEKRFQAMRELLRVAKKGAFLVIGCDSKYGFMRLYLSKGNLNEAIKMNKVHEAHCPMGPKTHVYSIDEMKNLLEKNGCKILEIASAPTMSDTFDKKIYYEKKWSKLKKLELELCKKPELLGMGHHLLFIAKKSD